MAIRPFTPGDIFLLHHLSRYVTPLHIEKSLLHSPSVLVNAMRSALPWERNGCMTFVLRQEENGLARAGLIQIELHADRPAAHVTVLTPAIDAPQGHPAIWQKLLSQSIHLLVERNVSRLYSDLPDQPLLVNTFKQSGFQVYARETIWRLAHVPAQWPAATPTPVRPLRPEDHWDLTRLYRQITPSLVQQAEGLPLEEESALCPILADDLGLPRTQFVLDGNNGLEGCVQIIWGRQGTWLRLWTDTNNPDTEAVRLLLRHAISEIAEDQNTTPIYIAERDYHAGIESILGSYGFAPFTDRARVVRNIWQWVQRPSAVRIPALESVREAVPGSLNYTQPVEPDGPLPGCTPAKTGQG